MTTRVLSAPCARVAGLFVFAVLAGCAGETMEQSLQKPLADPMNNILKSLIGQPASVAFNRLHYPDFQQVISDKKAYVWKIGNSCSLRLFANGSDVISNGDWTGNVMGCSVLIQRFNGGD